MSEDRKVTETTGKVIDLMVALKASLHGEGPDAVRAASLVSPAGEEPFSAADRLAMSLTDAWAKAQAIIAGEEHPPIDKLCRGCGRVLKVCQTSERDVWALVCFNTNCNDLYVELWRRPVPAESPESEPRRPSLVQRTDRQGVRLIRTGMSDDVVLADVAWAIKHHDLTLTELRAALNDHAERAGAFGLLDITLPARSTPVRDEPPAREWNEEMAGRLVARLSMALYGVMGRLEEIQQDDSSFARRCATQALEEARGALAELPAGAPSEGMTAPSADVEEMSDTERLDWMQGRVDGSGETMQFGGVCYWGIEIIKGPRSRAKRIGEGGDLREAIDNAMENEAEAHPGSPEEPS